MDPEPLEKTLSETFDLIKDTVRKKEGVSRAGLMLGLQELGSSPVGFIGGYYPFPSNIIVMNKTVIRRIQETNPGLLRPYVFHVLLHEYIHSLGILDERAARQKTYEISKSLFGEHHPATELSTNIRKFFPNLVYPNYGWRPDSQTPVELVEGFDKSNYKSYIS